MVAMLCPPGRRGRGVRVVVYHVIGLYIVAIVCILLCITAHASIAIVVNHG